MKAPVLAVAVILNSLAVGWALARTTGREVAPPVASAARGSPAPPVDEAPVPPQPADDPRQRARQDITDQRVQALERVLSQLKADAGAGAGGAGAPRLPPPQLVADQEVEAQRQRVTQLEALVASQSRDGQWAPGFEARLAALVGKDGGDATMASHRCFTSVCRLELEMPSEQSRRTFLIQLQRDVARENGAAGMMFDPVVGADGKPGTVVHVFRAGYPMPDL